MFITGFSIPFWVVVIIAFFAFFAPSDQDSRRMLYWQQVSYSQNKFKRKFGQIFFSISKFIYWSKYYFTISVMKLVILIIRIIQIAIPIALLIYYIYMFKGNN